MPTTPEQREASRLRNLRYRENNREKVRKTAREWRRKNKNSANQAARKWYRRFPERAKNWSLMKNHGITIDDFNKMFEAQGGKCKICDRKMKKSCVDHDHSTGRIRDLLCHSCNIALGLLQDSADVARKAAEYLTRHSKP